MTGKNLTATEPQQITLDAIRTRIRFTDLGER